jgi:ferredoxin-NADP reductase
MLSRTHERPSLAAWARAHTHNKMATMVVGRLVLLALVARSRGQRGTKDVQLAERAPREGTQCTLLSREVLTAADVAPAVHRLRFALPATARVPKCCGGEGGLLYVRVKAPDADGQPTRFKPYSAHWEPGENATFALVVKIYPGGPPATAGVSAYLGALAVGARAHVPEAQALDWRRDARRVAMVCFGVGLTECLVPAAVLLRAGAEVRLVAASRDAGQQILLDELRALHDAHPDRFRVRHCLSNASATAAADGGASGARVTRGRVDPAVLREEFGGAWRDGAPVEHFFIIGTGMMEVATLGMIREAELVDFSRIRGHPPFLLVKGPHGANSGWDALSPPASERDEECPG